jgi:hypothetical protein
VNTLSETVIVRDPAVFNTALNVPAPFVRVVSIGKMAVLSLLVKFTVPVYPVAVLPAASSAVAVKPVDEPAVTGDDADTANCVAGPGT